MTRRRGVRASWRRGRRTAYKIGREMGDIEALSSGDPSRISKRIVNKWIGRHVVNRLWWR